MYFQLVHGGVCALKTQVNVMFGAPGRRFQAFLETL